MRKKSGAILSAVFLFYVPSAGAKPVEPQSEIRQKPNEMSGEALQTRNEISGELSLSSGPPGQVRGFYSKGSLSRADVLTTQGSGFLKLHLWRNRGYGSTDLLEILERAAHETALAFPDGERLQVGDISSANGGPLSGHASHQNGLDADVVYFRVDHSEYDPEKTDGFPESFVNQGKVSRNFDTERNWRFLKILVDSKRVGRIFVDQAIKNHLCAYAKQIGEFQAQEETLRRLRPYPNHDDHLHLRITCPGNSPACQEQVPPPEGSGC